VSPTNIQNDGYFRSETAAAIFGVLRRQARVLAICFVALSAGVILAVVAAPPVYDGTLKILVKQDRADSVVSGSSEAAAARYYYRELTETEMMSQVELLKSGELIEHVAQETGLAARIHREQPALSQAEAIEEAATALRERLDVSPVRRTWLINVSYEGDDRAFTRNVLDTLARLYLAKHLALQRPAGTYQFFADQAQRAKRDLESLREQLASFSVEHQVVSAAVEKEAVLQKLNEFEGLRLQAAALLAESDLRLATVSTELTRVPKQHTSSVKTDAGVARDVTARIVTLEMQRTQLLEKFTPEYRGVLQVDAQLREARAALAAAARAPVVEETIADNPTRQWLDTEVARTRADQAALRARVRSLSTAVGDYRAKAMTLEVRDAEQQDLWREIKAAETRYLLYAQKQEEARISDELDRTQIANVVVAEGPSVAVEPRREPALAFLPLLLGIALLLSGAIALTVDGLTPAYHRWTTRERPVVAPIIVQPAPSEQPIS
jgi:uncharacterized protein involved in exopolysaccharide biosynthesis